MATLKSPRPTPRFFNEPQTFSTKKARATPREQLPPRPPVKSAPPMSRVFPHKYLNQRAQAVSFKGSDSFLSSKHYNETSNELYFDQCFEVVCKLGVGSFGEVFKVRSKEDGKYYAVKRSRERFKGESDRQRKLEEVKKHEELPKHPNCIYFIKAWEERQHLYIQTELCETSLSNYTEQNHEVPESVVWNYLVDLIQAIKHLHDHDLIHLDIKPANIFISKDNICKLGDFGLVLNLKKNDLSEAQEGDPKYLALELMEGKFSKAADIFSLGITILELACDLDLPQGGPGWHQLRQGNIPNDFLNCLSPELRKIICLMMMPDYKRRPTVDDILSMPVIQKVLRRRKICINGMKLLCDFTKIFHWLFLLLLSLLSAIMYPFRKLLNKKRRIFTPPLVRNPHVLEWDPSFSDDEVFDEEIMNTSQNSMAVPLSDSSCSDGKDSSFMNMSFHGRLVNSTPAMIKKPMQNVSTPYSPSPNKWRNKMNQLSPTSPTYRKFTPRSLNSKIGHNNSFNNEEEILNFSIGPRNLMNVFEAASEET